MLKEIAVPQLAVSKENSPIKPESFPAFSSQALAGYSGDGAKSLLRPAIDKARAALWAVSPLEAPTELRPDVGKLKTLLPRQLDRGLIQQQLEAPADAGKEKEFKTQLFNKEKPLSRIVKFLTDALEELQNTKDKRQQEPKRWQANYDYVQARLEMQLASIIEYESLLGAMRKDLPPRDPKLHNGWRLTAQEKLQGDPAGKKQAASAQTHLDKMIQDYAGTPWEELAKRDRQVPLGLEWQPAKLK